jgi:hypothetical protein
MKSILFSCLFLVAIQPLFAQLNIKGIAVFKDGNSFIYKQGTVETTNNQFRIKGDTIPNGLFGTFWAASPFLSKVTSIMDSVASVVRFVSF